MTKQFCIMMVSVLAAVAASAHIAFEVKDVEAHQRYPWNGKVDIDFTIDSAVEGSNFAVRVEAKDTVGKTNITLKTVKYEDKVALSSLEKLPAGRHRVTWDADQDVPDALIPSLAFSVSAWTVNEAIPENGLYMVIDLSAGTTEEGTGTRFPISYLTAVPKGGWTDEYKTTKLVLRRVPAGKDPLGRYELTQDFYVGVFEVTRKQWELVCGNQDALYYAGKIDGQVQKGLGTPCPVSYSAIRGSDEWPQSSSVGTSSFMGRLRVMTGYANFDLPTLAQWEYACRAGTLTDFNNGLNSRDVDTIQCKGYGYYALCKTVWFNKNSDLSCHAVGEKIPNAWGLYDMHGNLSEWCLDWSGDDDSLSLSGVDPKGPRSGKYRILCGGSYRNALVDCRTGLHLSDKVGGAGYTLSDYVVQSDARYGFRLVLTSP